MWYEEEYVIDESRRQRDYAREMNDLIDAERQRVLRIMKRIEDSRQALQNARRITSDNPGLEKP